MPGASTSIFISYSRRDSCFVDQLEAELKARQFDTLVVRRKIESNQPRKRALQNAIDQRDVLLVVLSSASVTSRYVQMEYGYALSKDKPVIALEYQPCQEVPIDLNDLQSVNFKTDREQGLRDLLIALSRVEIGSTSKPEQTSNVKRRSRFNVISPEPLPVELNIEGLYRDGVEAMNRGNPELAAALWQQVIDHVPKFRNGMLTPQLAKLLQELRSKRIAYFREHAQQTQSMHRLRQAAGFWQALLELDPEDSEARQCLEQCLLVQSIVANASGEWEQAISAWEALLKLKPGDALATSQLQLAQHNQSYVQYYEDARQFVEENELSYARIQLRRLWHYAPYYGDPEGLALKADITKPLRSPTTFYEEEKKRLVKEKKGRPGSKRSREASKTATAN